MVSSLIATHCCLYSLASAPTHLTSLAKLIMIVRLTILDRDVAISEFVSTGYLKSDIEQVITYFFISIFVINLLQ